MIFIIELLAIVIMAIHSYTKNYFSFQESLYQAFFTTISLFVNAGFDIAPSNDSFVMFKDDYFMQSLAMVLMIFGAMGFWPLFEIKEWIHSKLKRTRHKFSIFSKVLIAMHLGIWLISAIVFFGLESQYFLADKNIIEGIFYTLVMTLTTRNAGFSTMVISDLQEVTQVFFMALMFIGSSPNSAGGGIRTTTLLLIIAGVYAFAKGKKQVVLYERSVKHETIYKSFIVFFMAVVLITLNVMIITYFEPFDIHSVAFEVTSAFGTTGLSLGMSGHPNFGVLGKSLLIFTMFLGRVGLLAFLLMFKSKAPKGNIATYPEIDIIIG